MKKIVFGFICLVLMGTLSYILLKKVDADTHNYELVSSYTEGGYEYDVYNLYFTVTNTNNKINHVYGYIDIVGYEFIDFNINEAFQTETLQLDPDGGVYNEGRYTFSFVSNNTYTSSNGKVVYATVTLRKDLTAERCLFQFYAEIPNYVATNDVDIVKTSVDKTDLDTQKEITQVGDNDEFYYKIVLTNNSLIATDNVTLTDTIPDDFTILEALGGEISNQTITWNIGSMAVDEVVTVYVKVKVKEDANRTNYNITNTASVTVGDTTKSDDATVEILYSNINVEKKANVTQVRPNDTFTYQIVVENTGTGLSDNVTLTDTLDSDLSIISASESYNINDNTLTFNLGSLASNAKKTITLTVKLNGNTKKTSIINTAIATEDGKTPIEDEVTTPIVDSNIIIDKQASVDEVRLNDTFTYNITVKNTGTAPSKPITITDTLDNRLELVSSNVGSVSNNTYTYTIDSLGINEEKTITLTVRAVDPAKAEDSINNTATATEEGRDPISASDTVLVIDSSVTLTKTVSKSIVNVGEEFTYTINITNTSNYTTRELTLTDVINSDLSIVNTSAGSINGNTITYNIGTLEAHATKTVTITVKAKDTVTDNTTINNVAVLKEVGKPEQEDSATVTVVKPILSVTKTAVTTNNTNLVNPDEEFTYVIKVTNQGNGDATNVSITDAISSYLTIIDSDGGTVSNQVITWHKNIAAKGEVTLNVKVKVNSNVASNTIIPNTVKVTYNNDTLEDSDDVTVTDSLVTLTKTASIAKVQKGSNYYYTITVRNTGTDTATNITITDKIPEELSILSIDRPSGVSLNLTDHLITLSIASLAKDEAYEIKVYVNVTGDVKENDVIHNTAYLTYDDKQLESSADVSIIDSNITVTKTASKSYISPSDEYTYTITVSNRGSANANDIEVVDTFDEYLEIIDADNGIINTSNNTITWNIETLKANTTMTYTITVKAKDKIDKDTILNQVVVHTPDKPDVIDEVELDIAKPTFTVTKTSSHTEITRTTIFSYTITVTNTSSYDATGVILRDVIDEALIINSTEGGIISGNTITWTFDLQAQESITFTVKVGVKEDADLKEITNVAIVSHGSDTSTSNSIIVNIVDIINPQTGNLFRYSFLLICLIATTCIIIYTKKKKKMFKI